MIAVRGPLKMPARTAFANVASNSAESASRATIRARINENVVAAIPVKSSSTPIAAFERQNLHLADAVLNLPAGRHSHGLRELAAVEATRGSYEEAKAAIERASGQVLGGRQVEELARAAATDVDAFYEQVRREEAPDDVLVVAADGKGIVMRPDSLREPTRKKAYAASKLELDGV